MARPPPKTKAPNTTAYCALYIDGHRVQTRHLAAHDDCPDVLDSGRAVVWSEGKSRKVNFFLFKLTNDQRYILRVQYFPRRGIEASLIYVGDLVVDCDNYRAIAKRADVLRLRSEDVDNYWVFERTLPIAQSAGATTTVFFQLEYLCDEEIVTIAGDPISV